MANKIDFKKLMKQYEPAMKKTGDQILKAVKKAEDDISKMYRITQTHVEIQMGNLQKEKLYHELGRVVAGMILRGEIANPVFDKYKKNLEKINNDNEKMHKKLSRVAKARKKK